MVVRRMRPEDASDAHTIHTQCLTRTLREQYNDEQRAAWLSGRSPEGYLRAAASGEHFFVAEQEGAVIGFASWRDDELLALFVHPDEQMKSVGSTLLTACLDDAASQGHVITVLKATMGSVNFYERYGFRVITKEADVKLGVEIPHILMRRDSPGR
jgi:GNAT superfamily N-acetyltransferase